MSTPSPVGPTPLPTFARSAAATVTDLAHRATEMGTPGGTALAGLLGAGAAELSALAGDATLAAVSVSGGPAIDPSTVGGLGQLLVVPLELFKSVTVALTLAASGSATGAVRSSMVEAAMVAARRQAALRIAAALAASGQVALLGAAQLGTLAAAAPGAAGSVGTPSAFAPVVLT